MVVIGGDCRIFVGGQSSVKVGGVAVHVETRLGVVRDTPRRFHAILGDPIRQDTVGMAIGCLFCPKVAAGDETNGRQK